ncbi:hypothetical protein, partial [Sandarakinorhabdus oryzae]|uniref:hypothetical protein n=1 Tax=Sandarakinorhabdus oryzae TaxID=2675220 RepID=UPI0018CC1F7C
MTGRNSPPGGPPPAWQPALAAATAKLDSDPDAALAAADALLAAQPELQPAQLLAGQALRRL